MVVNSEGIVNKILRGKDNSSGIVHKIIGTKGHVTPTKVTKDVAGVSKLSKNQFYSVVLKKVITIPDNKIRAVNKGGRHFMVGSYEANGKKYDAWKVVGKA